MASTQQTTTQSPGLVYSITNTTTGDIYVGSTRKTLHIRFINHCNFAVCDSYVHKSPFHRAIQQYGRGAFEASVIEEFDDINQNNLLNLEAQYIRDIGTYNKKIPNRTSVNYYQDNA